MSSAGTTAARMFQSLAKATLEKIRSWQPSWGYGSRFWINFVQHWKKHLKRQNNGGEVSHRPWTFYPSMIQCVVLTLVNKSNWQSCTTTAVHRLHSRSLDNAFAALLYSSSRSGSVSDVIRVKGFHASGESWVGWAVQHMVTSQN